MLPISEIINRIDRQGRDDFDGKYYLALVVNERTVQSGVWGITAGKGKLFSCGSLEGWNGENAEELIVAADASIATAVSKMPEISGKQPTEVLLGLPEYWVKGEGLRTEKTKILNTVCKKLLFSPLGFVVTPEAISHLLKEEEGESLDLILVSLEEAEMIVSLIVRGKFLGSKIVERSDNSALDLEEGLLRFNFQDDLPSRIVLLGSGDLNEAQQVLIAYPWLNPNGEKKLSFLHLPKVDFAKENLEISAVVYGGSRDLLKEKIAIGKEIVPEKIETVVEEAIEKKEGPTTDYGLPTTAEPREEINFKADFGFVKGQDILISQPVEQGVIKSEEIEKEIEEIKTAVKEEKPKRRLFDLKVIFKKRLKVFPEGRFEPELVPVEFPTRRKSILKKIIRFLKNLTLNKITFLLFLVLVVIGTILAVCLYKIEKAEIKLLVRPLAVEKEFEFSVSTKVAEVDPEKMILPAQTVEAEVRGEKGADVKGKKIVGDKATGEIVVYNRTDQPKDFSKGQVVKGPADLKFVFKEDVEVASKTADLEKGIDKWGEAKVKVEAIDIGPQYNLEASSTLVLENFSTATILVKNPGAFSGGTSREIQAVSKEDRENLQKQLTEELTKKAQEEIKGKISSTDYLLINSLEIKSRSSVFNHEVSDEAPTITLQDKVIFSALFFKEGDVLQLIEKQTAGLPEGYQEKPFKEENSYDPKDKSGVYLAKVKRFYYPNLPVEEIRKNLVKKTFLWAGSYLKDLNTIEGYEISINPSIFSKLNLLPFNFDNIKVTIDSLGQ